MWGRRPLTLTLPVTVVVLIQIGLLCVHFLLQKKTQQIEWDPFCNVYCKYGVPNLHWDPSGKELRDPTPNTNNVVWGGCDSVYKGRTMPLGAHAVWL